MAFFGPAAYGFQKARDEGRGPVIKRRKRKKGFQRIGRVTDAGGGYVTVFVDRDLQSYPGLGQAVYVAPTEDA